MKVEILTRLRERRGESPGKCVMLEDIMAVKLELIVESERERESRTNRFSIIFLQMLTQMQTVFVGISLELVGAKYTGSQRRVQGYRNLQRL